MATTKKHKWGYYFAAGIIILLIVGIIIGLLVEYLNRKKMDAARKLPSPGPTNQGTDDNGQSLLAQFPLQEGSSGPQVAALQTAMNGYIDWLGLPNMFTDMGIPYPLPITGIYDHYTAAAVQITSGMVYDSQHGIDGAVTTIPTPDFYTAFITILNRRQ